MRFLVDECTGPAVAEWLCSQGHDAFSVFDELPGISDEEVIRRAYDERRILITNDKDFGEKVYRQRHPHHGVVSLYPTKLVCPCAYPDLCHSEERSDEESL
jgi:predicted nuclease of predicted toxin-antitoxin system